MIGRTLFRDLVNRNFADKYADGLIPDDYSFEEAWRDTVNGVYNNIVDDASLTFNKIQEIGLYYHEAMDMDNNVRCCSNCGRPIVEGYYLDGEYACSDECAIALYAGNEAQFREDLSHAFDNEWEVYWTEWENNYFFD